MVKRGKEIPKDTGLWIKNPYHKRDDAQVRKKFCWICENCGKEYIFRDEAKECERKHDMEAKPEKYIDENIIEGYKTSWISAYISLQKQLKKRGDDSNNPFSKVKQIQNTLTGFESKLIEYCNTVGTNPDDMMHELFTEAKLKLSKYHGIEVV